VQRGKGRETGAQIREQNLRARTTESKQMGRRDIVCARDDETSPTKGQREHARKRQNLRGNMRMLPPCSGSALARGAPRVTPFSGSGVRPLPLAALAPFCAQRGPVAAAAAAAPAAAAALQATMPGAPICPKDNIQSRGYRTCAPLSSASK